MANDQLQVALQGASEQLQRYKPKLKAALPSHIKPEKFERVIMTVLNQNPELLSCDRVSLFTACTKCAQDGLIPDGREAALVPFKGQVQYMPMVYGLIKRTRQSGELASLSAHVVYENDTFDYALGDDEHIDHKPRMDADRGKIIAAYAIAKLKDGTVQREVMTVAEIEQVRSVSRAKNAGPWTQWYGEMARKTVVRRLCKYLPLSAELMRAVRRDDVFVPMGNGEAADDIGEELRDITPETPRPTPEDYEAAEPERDEAAHKPAHKSEPDSGTQEPSADAPLVKGGPIDFLANWTSTLNKCDSAEKIDALVAANAERIARFEDEELRNRIDEATTLRRDALSK